MVSVAWRHQLALFHRAGRYPYNHEVREYLRFVQIDTFTADGLAGLHFGDALYYYEQMTYWAVETGNIGKKELEDCQAFIQELRSLPTEPDLRAAIEKRMGYVPRTAPSHRDQ